MKPILLILFIIITIGTQAQAVIYDIGYGRLFNNKGNPGMTTFLDNYLNTYGSEIKDGGKDMKWQNGFEIQQMLMSNRFIMEFGYTRLRSKSKVVFKSGDVRNFELRNVSGLIAMGLLLIGNIRFYSYPYFAFNVGRTKLISEFQQAPGSSQTGKQLTGEYKGMLIYSDLGLGFRFNADKFGIYGRMGWTIPASRMELETDDLISKKVPIDYETFVSSGSSILLEKVESRFGGLQFSIGVVIHLLMDTF